MRITEERQRQVKVGDHVTIEDEDLGQLFGEVVEIRMCRPDCCDVPCAVVREEDGEVHHWLGSGVRRVDTHG